MNLSDIKQLIVEKLDSENIKQLNENARTRHNIEKAKRDAKFLMESEKKANINNRPADFIIERPEDYLNDDILEAIASSERSRMLAGTDKED